VKPKLGGIEVICYLIMAFSIGVAIGSLSTEEADPDEINEINGKLYKLVEVQPVYEEVGE